MDHSFNDSVIENVNRNKQSIKKTNIIKTDDSLSKGINEKLASKENHVKIQNFPGETVETILNKVEKLVKNNPNSLIVHAGTNDTEKSKNVLTILKKVKNCSQKQK